MTAITASAKLAPTLSGLVTNGSTAGTGILCTWDALNDAELASTQVWVATSNNRALATLAATVTGNSYFHIGTSGITYYFWIRAVNVYNKANGAYFPVSSTAGVPGVISKIATFDLDDNAISNHVILQSSTPLAFPSITTTHTLFDVLYAAEGGVVTIKAESAGAGFGLQSAPTTATVAGTVAGYHLLYISEVTSFPRVGTTTFTNNSNQVVGVGTNFVASMVGHPIGFSEGRSATVLSVQDSTHLTLEYPWPNATVTDSPDWYCVASLPSSGAITLTNNSKTVTGSGANFSGEMVGRTLTVSGSAFTGEVASVANANSLQLVANWGGTTTTANTNWFWTDLDHNNLITFTERNYYHHSFIRTIVSNRQLLIPPAGAPVVLASGSNIGTIASDTLQHQSYPYSRELTVQTTAGKLYEIQVLWYSTDSGTRPEVAGSSTFRQLTIKEFKK